jgi:hypothetical protein
MLLMISTLKVKNDHNCKINKFFHNMQANPWQYVLEISITHSSVSLLVTSMFKQ